MAKLVSETYGEALFSLGMEKEIVDSLMDEIDSLWKILKENPGFSSLMNHPDIGRDEKLEILHNVFEGKLSDTLYGFLEVLIHKGRYGAIDEYFYLLYGQIQGFPQNRGGICYQRRGAYRRTEGQDRKTPDRNHAVQ